MKRRAILVFNIVFNQRETQLVIKASVGLSESKKFAAREGAGYDTKNLCWEMDNGRL
jgi:hypothetical protein